MEKKAGRPRRYSEGKKQMGVWLTEEAIASLGNVANALDISRSELLERYGRNYHHYEAVLNAVEQVLYDGESTMVCLPPHPSYVVSGDVFRRLAQAFTELMEAEGKGSQTTD